jgi:alpha-beta hydrolase superfamily lysophospholipase
MMRPGAQQQKRTALVVAFLLGVLALGACAPRVAPESGAEARSPARMSGDALVMPDGVRLPLYAWRALNGDPEAVILGVHGFNDYGHAFAMPGAWFAARNVTVYAYDQRGFGGAPHPGVWPGERRLTRDLATAVRLIRARHPKTPLYLLGTSMGGAVVLAAAAHGDLPPVAGLALAAPAVWARETMPLYQRAALWLGAHTVPWLTLSGEGLGRQASDNIPMLRALGGDPNVIKETRIDAMHGLVNLMDTAFAAGAALPAPALLLYGAKDEIVPPGPTLAMWRDAAPRPGVRAVLYPEGWHMLLRDLQAPTVWRDIRAWMRDPRAPLPSKAHRAALTRLETLNGGAGAPASRASGS